MHISVLLKEAIDILDLHEGDVYLDATLGAGGHAEKIAEKWGDKITVAGIDTDPLAVEASKLRLEMEGFIPRFAVLNFRNIAQAPELLGIERPTKILFDLGWNKSQFDTQEGKEGRGFSFQRDEPLLMTFGSVEASEFTAETIVNTWDRENIEIILQNYGEETFARRISEKIVEAREKQPIKTSGQLADIVYHAVPVWYRFKRIHPATKTFQALRITVNDELRALEEGLKGALESVQSKGIVAVISFHSLEDRIVKRFFREAALANQASLLTKKPIIPTEEEIAKNPRSRSAKLRAIQKI